MNKIFTNFESFLENNSKFILTAIQIKKIIENYFEAAIFTEEEKIKKDYEDIDDDIMNVNNFTDTANKKVRQDIFKLISKCPDAVKEAIDENGLEIFGHDLWFSTNGHGSGFFDKNYENGTELEKNVKSLKSKSVHITNDNKLDFD